MHQFTRGSEKPVEQIEFKVQLWILCVPFFPIPKFPKESSRIHFSLHLSLHETSSLKQCSDLLVILLFPHNAPKRLIHSALDQRIENSNIIKRFTTSNFTCL